MDEVPTTQIVVCDRCSLSFCSACSRLSPTELRSATLKKRILVFLCSNCRVTFDRFLQSVEPTDDDTADAFSRSDQGGCKPDLKEIVASVVGSVIPGILEPVVRRLTELVVAVDKKFDNALRAAEESLDAKSDGGGVYFAAASPVIGPAQPVIPTTLLEGTVVTRDFAAGGLNGDDVPGTELESGTGNMSAPPTSRRKSKAKINEAHNVPRTSAKKKSSKNGHGRGPLVMASDGDSGGSSVSEVGQNPITLSQVGRGVEEAWRSVAGTGGAGNGSSRRVVPVSSKHGRHVSDPICRGTAVEQTGFTSGPRRVWLYVGGADSKTSVDAVKRYVMGKLTISEDQLVVEALGSGGQTRSFKVGVDSSYCDTVHAAEFWPRDILFRRFWIKPNRRVTGFPMTGQLSTVK